MTVHYGGKVSAAGDGSPEHKAFIVKKQTAVNAVFRAPSSFYVLSDLSLVSRATHGRLVLPSQSYQDNHPQACPEAQQP